MFLLPEPLKFRASVIIFFTSPFSGHEGLKLFQTYRNQIDLIICDMIMPKMNGFELGHKLREIDPCVKLLLSSGSLEMKMKKISQTEDLMV